MLLLTLFTQLPCWQSAPNPRRQFCIRARVNSCRKPHQVNPGFRPGASIACRSGLFRQVPAALLLSFAIALSACHSYHIAVTIRNSTGGAISLLEVDYPSASFGADALASDADFHHLIQTRGSAPLKVQYTAANGRQIQITGPTLSEKQQGSIEIILLPDGKAEFHPSLNPAH
jgi:hypothetical protein